MVPAVRGPEMAQTFCSATSLPSMVVWNGSMFGCRPAAASASAIQVADLLLAADPTTRFG
jgi:hypothetical protein